MIGWAFAAALLAFPIASWLHLLRLGIDRPGAGSRGAVAVLVALAVGAAGFAWDQHRRLEGTPPLIQYLVALPSAGAVFALGRSYPEGWLDESPILRSHPEEAEVPALGARPAWSLPQAEAHTVLSGLYAMRPTRIRYWYPGGRLRDALARIEVRIVD